MRAFGVWLTLQYGTWALLSLAICIALYYKSHRQFFCQKLPMRYLALFIGWLIVSLLLANDKGRAWQGQNLHSLWIWAVGLAPIYEELIFREWLYRPLADMGLRIPAILIGALLFALAHGQYSGYDMALLACFGVLLGMVRAYGLGFAIILHMVNNMLALLYLLFSTNGV